MDPNQQPQPSPRPGQRTPYISDFVPGRPQPVAPSPAPPVIAQQPFQSASQQAGQLTGQPVRPTTTPMPDSPLQPRPATAMVTPMLGAADTTSRRPSFAIDEPEPVAPLATKVIKPHQGLRDILSIFSVLASALLLAFCLITFVFQSYQVDGPSMQSTLQNSDHLIVWKVPRTIASLTHHNYIPNRGDIIVFNESGINGSEKKQLIKRVIGLPGERVVFKGTAVMVYNAQHPEGFSPDETLGYGKGLINQNPSNDDVTLGANELFVAGDHRDNSLDSRIFGPIQSDQIVGKLVLRVLPLNTATKF